jgi:GT2 family glycosyltransferase
VETLKITIALVFITYNRLDYTRLSLPQLLADPTEEFNLTIWDNGSTDGTQNYLHTVRDRRIVDIVFSSTNKGQAYVTNKVWGESTADLVGKVDNDCLVTPGWTRILTQAHEDIDNLGVIGCWHFFPEEFDYEKARHKIQTFGNHQIFRHPWVDGSALLLKRKVYLRYGPCLEKDYLTRFWLRLAVAGYINGFYYPLVYQEHMDDPRSQHTVLKTEKDFQNNMPHTARNRGIYSLKDWEQCLRNDAVILQTASINPKLYVGWRAKLRRLRSRIRKYIKSNIFRN